MNQTPPKERLSFETPEQFAVRQAYPAEPPYTPLIAGMVTRPYVPDSAPGIVGFWVACVKGAATSPKMRAAFTADTGLSLGAILGATPLERAIDETTGYCRHVFSTFADWVTVKVWGIDSDPTQLCPHCVGVLVDGACPACSLSATKGAQ